MGIFAQRAAEAAEKNFQKSMNCAETLVRTFDELCGLGIGKEVRLSAGFGGGMGRAGDLCGALAGAMMIVGAFKGRPDPLEGDRKAITPFSRELHERFMAANGSTDCDDIRKFPFDTAEQKANCHQLVMSTASMLGQFLVDKGLVEDE